MKKKDASSTLKKVVILLRDRTPLRGYLNPARLGREEMVEILSPEGEHKSIALKDVKSVYFVREFEEPFEPERKAFLSRPKLDGLWVRLRFHDEDEIEGMVSNDLLDMLDAGVQLTPPDLHGNALRMFIPRSALQEMKVLGVVGAGRRTIRDAGEPPVQPAAAQSKLFAE